MMKNEREEIDRLLARYYAAETTEAEEAALRGRIRRMAPCDGELRMARTIFAGFDALACERAAGAPVLPSRPSRPSRRGVRTVVAALAAAAVLAGVAVGAALLLRTPYCYIDGEAVYDREVALRMTAYLEGLADLDVSVRMMDAWMDAAADSQ